MVLSIESSNGYFIFYDRDGNEVSKQMSTQEAVEQIWSIKSSRR